MIYAIDIDRLPSVEKLYKVRRRTVWQITDPYNILLYVAEGHCLLRMDGETFEAEPGDVFFIPHGQRYLRCPKDEEMCTFFYLHFRSEEPRLLTPSEAASEISETKARVNRALLSGEAPPDNHTVYCAPHMRFSENAEEIASLYEKAYSAYLRHHLESALQNALLLGQMLALGSRVTTASLPGGTTLELRAPMRLQKAVAYIRQNYTQKFTLQELCSVCSVTRQQMIRYFRSELNTTPMQYVLSCRLNRAKELLLDEPQLSIAEVAEELGFDDAHYFSRIFKKHCGETPSAFAKRVHSFDETKQ